MESGNTTGRARPGSDMNRRGVIGSLLAAPFIVRTPGLLMPVKPPLMYLPPRIHAEDIASYMDYTKHYVFTWSEVEGATSYEICLV